MSYSKHTDRHLALKMAEVNGSGVLKQAAPPEIHVLPSGTGLSRIEEEPGNDDSMVGPVVPRARKRRVSSSP